ncbi:hypothetical protein CR513_62651, partial [Mucuna pruriens]
MGKFGVGGAREVWNDGHKESTRQDGTDQGSEQLASKANSSNLQGPLLATIYRPSVGKMIFQVICRFILHLVDQHKTSFTCPFSTFAYTRMPFGLYNTPNTF